MDHKAADNRNNITFTAVERVCRQYQQEDPAPDLPGPELLKQHDVQEYIYEKVFAQGILPSSYALRVLKALVSEIEASIDDWEEYAVSDNLIQCLANFHSSSQFATFADATNKSPVVYYISALEEAVANQNNPPTITLLENRGTIAAVGTTGIRTWEAALHLGAYLCHNTGLVRGKRIFELGAGTGYVSVLCAKFLGAAASVATDGSSEVVHSLPANLELNGLRDLLTKEVDWGPSPPADWSEWNGDGFDVILGADITFDARDLPDLLATIRWCLAAKAIGDASIEPSQKTVLIAATERNRKTFDTFAKLAVESFDVEYIAFPLLPRAQQMGPFYSDASPIHICRLRPKGISSNEVQLAVPTK
ncbi:hypothetical protein SEPCBS57363_006010 [Sporothrix epigloea]|uniref:FAM86A protein n=1 Tax=Sporothrix epigloea TaxID=1892477 RepID=A0ABP0E2L2_9PEZI